MQLYHVLLEQRAAFLTEPTSGVLMGSLAWAYRDLYGEAALGELLAAYRAADQADAAPPLICSAALPAGWLPRPHFTYLAPAERTQLAAQQFKNSGAAALLRLDQALNQWRGQRWLPQAALRTVVEQLDAFHLFGALLKQMDAPSVRLVSGPTGQGDGRNVALTTGYGQINGQTVGLVRPGPPPYYDWIFINQYPGEPATDYAFQVYGIPEPTGVALLGLGLLLQFRRRFVS